MKWTCSCCRVSFVFLFALFSNHVKAQYITIPDTNFLAFLQTEVPGCLNGNQLDLSCPAVVNMTVLQCTNSNIADLTGLEAFVNLTELLCAGNELTSLPNLPASLTILDCTDNQIASLPTLPAALIVLNCMNNSLTSLPSLPASLETLACNSNQLSFLPSLPASLTGLGCYDNQLTSLPSLSASLTILDCPKNQLTFLPSLPASLTYLNCSENPLTSLPSLPASLTELFCVENQLTSLPSLPASLEKLWCYDNQLTSLPSLPASLEMLHCYNNQLTSLPSLPASMDILHCYNNQLTELPSLPAVMSSLNISNNPGITCLPPIQILTGSAYSSGIDGTGIVCLPNIILHNGSMPSIDTLPVCDIFNPNNCQVGYNIAGNIHKDDNASCTIDSGEQKLNNVKIQLHQGGNLVQQVFSNGAGSYSFDADLGVFEASIDTTGLPFNVTCPAANIYNSNLTVTDSMDYSFNFSLECKPGYDLAVQSAGLDSGFFFPAQNAIVVIHAADMAQFYGATCNTAGLTGAITATYSGPASISSVSGNGTVAGNTVT